jgi:hypothetical protein
MNYARAVKVFFAAPSEATIVTLTLGLKTGARPWFDTGLEIPYSGPIGAPAEGGSEHA